MNGVTTLTRIDEIQRMFEEIGLGRQEDRERLIELGRLHKLADIGSEPTPRGQLFIRLDGNTSEADESPRW
jgi:hypothetical protein